MLQYFLFFFFFLPGLETETKLKGFKLLDTGYRGYVPAGDSIVRAQTPFYSQLSICYWFNQPWSRFLYDHMGGVEVRTNLSIRDDRPANANWPALYLRVKSGQVCVTSVHCYKIKTNPPNINLLRKWIHLCFSFDFVANEMQAAINGEVFEKIKDPQTNPVYQQQIGKPEILQETEKSNF